MSFNAVCRHIQNLYAKAQYEASPLLEFTYSNHRPTPWDCASPGPHRWGEAFSPAPPYYEPNVLTGAQGISQYLTKAEHLKRSLR